MQISFAGEAYEAFQNLLRQCRGYGVTITTQDGEVFDAVLVGPDLQNEWGDTVLAHEVGAGDDYRAPEAYTKPPRSVRVADVHIN
jgi:hypothetical protein